MPKWVEDCVESVKDDPEVEDPWALCTWQYERMKDRKANINKKLRNKLKAMLRE